MLLKSLTLCCLILNVQPQNFPMPNQFYSPILNPDRIYFADNRPVALPLSAAPDKSVIKTIFQEPLQKNNVSPSVEIQKSDEIASYQTTEVEQVTKSNVPRSKVSRDKLTQSTPNRVIATQNSNRPTATQDTLTPNESSFNRLLYSVTNFGINLLKTINANQPGNVVLSPYSITSLLALLQQGALGKTQDQITNALQMSPEASASSYAQVSTDYKSRNSRNILKTACNLFIADAFNLNPDFKKIATRDFDSNVTPISYANPDRAARQINNWVASKTNHKIEQLVAPDALDHTTQVVLVNAIYFKGLWEVPFRVESTIPREFHLSNGQTKTAQFMRMRKLFRTGMDPATNAKVILLPFEGAQYSLMVILPSQLVGLTGTLSSLSDARLLSYLSFSVAETELELPKFTVKADTDLSAALESMGITNIFGNYAELNRLGTYRSYSPQISSAVHSAVLSIDEQGGSAAAATAFAAVALSYDEPSVVFKANRPFIAVLWDTESSLPLFMAKIEDPQQ